MNRSGRLPVVLALAEQVGGLERLVELEVELVKTRPIPEALIAKLASTPLAQALESQTSWVARAYGVSSLEPEDMTAAMRRVLELVCLGNTTKAIAAETGWPHDTVRDLVKALRALFRARNSAHLCALAVARGYVDPLARAA